MGDTLDRIIVNGVEQAVEAGADMTEPWNTERARREKTEENRKQLPPVDPPFPIPEGGGGAGGSGILVAHATVDMADFDNFSPETPLPITLDKTYAELAAEEVSAVMISWEQAGTPVADSLFMLDSNTAVMGVLFFDAPVYVNEALFQGTGWKVLVTVTSGEGAALVALTASSGGDEPLVLTSDNFDMTTFTGTIDQSFADMEAAFNSHRRLFVELFSTRVELTVINDNAPASELLSSTFIYDTGSLAGVVLAKAIVYVDNTDPNDPTLMLRAEMYALTPVSGS